MINQFLSGAAFCASIVVALIFWRMWRDTRDRLFIFFVAAFAVMSVERVLLALISGHNESAHYIYLIRLLAFSLIIWGIVEKNRKG